MISGVQPVRRTRSIVTLTVVFAPAEIIAGRYPSTYLVLVSRTETDSTAALMASAWGYMTRAQQSCELEGIHGRQYGDDRRLRMWKIRSCSH